MQSRFLAFVQDDLLTPGNVAKAAERYRRRLVERSRSIPDRRKKLADEAASVQAQIDRLVSALAAGVSSPTVAMTFSEREGRLAAIQAELAQLDSAAGRVVAPSSSMAEIEARLRQFTTDLHRLPAERMTPLLQGVLGVVEVTPLEGSWAKGWALKLNPRPLALFGPEVGDSFGCGARI